MHGILLKGLKEFAVDSYGRDTWNRIREEAPVERKVYLPIETYDDEELTALAEAASSITGESTDEILEAYGRAVCERLLSTYDNVVEEEWSAIDLIANLEPEVHTALRNHSPKMDPPTVDCQRSDDRIVVQYDSHRDLCPVAKGLIHGVGDHYGENFVVTERRCSRDGADRCELVLNY
jgi:predicted hydrocarbon binding protein